jgi:hypothetical protein
MTNKCVYNPKKHHNNQKKHHNNIVKKSIIKNNSKKSIIKLEDKDYLTKFGYSTKLSIHERHKILLIAVSKYGYSNVIHRLVALRTLTKNKQPKKSKKYNNDIIELHKWKKYMERIMKGGNNSKNISKNISKNTSKNNNLSKNNITKINKIIKNILEIEKKSKK